MSMDPGLYPSGKQVIPEAKKVTTPDAAKLVPTYGASDSSFEALTLANLFSKSPDLVPQALTASGAINADAKFVTLAHASVVIAATIAAPAPGRFLVIANTSASGTAAHTVTLTAGTWDGTNTIATLNAPGECLIVFGISATRFVIVENIGAVALS